MATEKKDVWGDWNTNCSKGVIDALVEVGRMMDYYYGDNNTGNMEALNDYIDDLIGGSGHGASIPEEYADKYLMQEGRCNGYIQTLIMIRALAGMKGW